MPNRKPLLTTRLRAASAGSARTCAANEGRLLRAVGLAVFALSAIAPCRAADLVFRQGLVDLSDADKQTYARIDLHSGTFFYPFKIAGPNDSVWQVAAQKGSVNAWSGRASLPPIYVPAGEYVLWLWVPPVSLSPCRMGVPRGCACPGAYTVLDPAEMAVRLKAESGARYEITATYPRAALPPGVQASAGQCTVNETPLPGIARVCITKTGGSKVAEDAVCEDTKYYLAAWPMGAQYGGSPGPTELAAGLEKEKAWRAMPSAAHAREGSFLLKGILVDAKKAPLAGWTVVVREMRLAAGSYPFFDRVHPVYGSNAAEGTTGPDGHFELSVPKAALDVDGRWIRFTLFALRPDNAERKPAKTKGLHPDGREFETWFLRDGSVETVDLTEGGDLVVAKP
jgi:hypothetical protein